RAPESKSVQHLRPSTAIICLILAIETNSREAPQSAVKQASHGRHIRSYWPCLKSSANGIRLCRLMCGSAPRFRRLAQRTWGCAPKPGRSPKFNIELAGRPEAFRTSDGTAGPLKEFLGKASHTR